MHVLLWQHSRGQNVVPFEETRSFPSEQHRTSSNLCDLSELKGEKKTQNHIYVRPYWLFAKYGGVGMVCECVGLTAFAVHVSVTLTVQHSVFVSDSIQENGNSNKRVTAIGYPRHTLAPTLTLLLHQLRQTLPQLLLLAADTDISSTNTQCDSFKKMPFLLLYTHTAHSSFSFLMELYKTCRSKE